MCPPGKYLDVDIINKKSICAKCPDDTISNGNSLVYSNDNNNLAEFVNRSFLICARYANLSWIYDDCENWNYNHTSGYIESGSIQTVDFCSFEFDHPFKLVNDGTIDITIQFDSSPESSGANIGKIYIYLNSDLVYESIEANSEFHVISINVPKGEAQMVIVYSKLNSIYASNYKARIKRIEVHNSTYGPYECRFCGNNLYTNIEKTSCQDCPRGYYINSDDECIQCPQNTTSVPGSHGIAGCIPLPLCSSSNIISTYHECINGKVNVTYSWDPYPLIQCTQGTLPSTISIDCDKCMPGLYNSIEDNVTTCTPCSDGMYILI
jgi:hypothetical protein